MQHTVDSFNNNGGPSTGVKLLMKSSLNQKYQFKLLVERGRTKSIILKVRDLISQIKKVKPDMVHIRGLQSSGFLVLLAARLAGCKKVVVSVHGIAIDSKLSFIKRFIYRKFVEPYTLRNADLVYCVCNYAASRPYVYQNTKNLFGVIHNAAPIYIDRDNDEINNLRGQLGILKNEILVVYVGRIVIDKGLKYLAKAIIHLKNEPLIRFLIVGEGEYLHDLRMILAKEIESGRVILLGKRGDVSNILFASNIFVFPSLRENLANVLLEASEAELPIIATEVGGNSEVIQNNHNGVLIPPRNYCELSKWIEYLAKDPNERKRLGTNAKNIARTKFNQQIIFDKLGKAYEKALGL